MSYRFCWLLASGIRIELQFHPDPVEFYSKHKFEKLVHLVGFIIRSYITIYIYIYTHTWNVKSDDGCLVQPKHVDYYNKLLLLLRRQRNFSPVKIYFLLSCGPLIWFCDILVTVKIHSWKSAWNKVPLQNVQVRTSKKWENKSVDSNVHLME